MLSPVVHILPLTTIMRPRLLPAPGTVHVRVGQKVASTDVVAETSLAREHILIDVAHVLGLSPQKADQLLKVKRGDKLKKGAVIAEGGGLIARAIRVPQDGRVLAAGGGQVILQTSEAPFDLRAGYPGVIAQVIEQRGVIIQASGAIVQGVWGNGRIDYGLLFSLADTPKHIIAAGDIDVSLRGSVLLGGYLGDEKALRNAAELPVRGLIVGTMSPALIPLAMQMKFPVVVIDALGRRDINQAAFKLLSTNAKREVAVVAEQFDRYSGARPEVFIPLPFTQEPPVSQDVVILVPGQQVRLLRSPNAGAVGTIVSLTSGLVTMPNGLKVFAAEVKLESGGQAVVPVGNSLTFS
jgi:hypothetical protein